MTRISDLKAARARRKAHEASLTRLLQDEPKLPDVSEQYIKLFRQQGINGLARESQVVAKTFVDYVFAQEQRRLNTLASRESLEAAFSEERSIEASLQERLSALMALAFRSTEEEQEKSEILEALGV